LVHSAGALVERARSRTEHRPPWCTATGGSAMPSRSPWIRQTGRALLSLGLGKGDRVAVLMTDRRSCSTSTTAPCGPAGRRPAERQGIRLGPRVHHRRLRRPGRVHDASKADRVAGARAETDVEHVFSVDADAVLDGGGYLRTWSASSRTARVAPRSPRRPVRHLLHRRHHRPAQSVEHNHRAFARQS